MKHRVRHVTERTLNDLLGAPAPSGRQGGPAHRVALASQKPLRDLTAAELHLLLASRVGPTFLLPLAVRELALDPWRVIDYEVGGLLEAVVDVDIGHWPPGHDWLANIKKVVDKALATVDELYDFERNSRLERKLQALQDSLERSLRGEA